MDITPEELLEYTKKVQFKVLDRVTRLICSIEDEDKTDKIDGEKLTDGIRQIRIDIMS